MARHHLRGFEVRAALSLRQRAVGRTPRSRCYGFVPIGGRMAKSCQGRLLQHAYAVYTYETSEICLATLGKGLPGLGGFSPDLLQSASQPANLAVASPRVPPCRRTDPRWGASFIHSYAFLNVHHWGGTDGRPRRSHALYFSSLSSTTSSHIFDIGPLALHNQIVKSLSSSLHS